MASRTEAARALLDTGFLEELRERLDARYWKQWKETTDDQELRDLKLKSTVLADLCREVQKTADEVIDYGRTDRAASSGR